MSLYDAPSGDFTPFVKYNAKAGRWMIKDGDSDREIQNPTFIADFANAKKAWMYFMEGQAPDIVYFPSLEAQLEKPSEKHKLGVSVMLFSNDAFGGVVKLESNSINTCQALGELHKQYEGSPESKTGKLPVVAVKGAEPIKGNYGTNYKPVFEIVKWVDRPAAFDETSEENSETPAPTPETAAASASEF